MIFVTGGTGLLGSYLLFELTQKEQKIVALKRKQSDLSYVLKLFKYFSPAYKELYSKIEWVTGDVLDYEKLLGFFDEIEVVYHLSAKVSFNPWDKYDVLRTNIRGTENIVNACLEKRVKKLCYASSVAALGQSPRRKETTEVSPRLDDSTLSAYSESKFKSELEIWRGIHEGLKTVIVNPSIIFGAGNWNIGSPRMFKAIWKGLKFYTEGITGFVDARDVARLMVRLTDDNVFGERFIISSENLSYKEILTCIADCLGKSRPNMKITNSLSQIIWRLEHVRSNLFFSEPLLTKETAQASHNEVFYSNQKIIDKTGHSFIPIKKSIEDISRIFLMDYVNSSV
jgi:dihydroflavonol-4-reductase